MERKKKHIYKVKSKLAIVKGHLPKRVKNKIKNPFFRIIATLHKGITLLCSRNISGSNL